MANQNIKNFPRYERYKDSGVDWLEQAPESWKIWRLFSLAKIKSITNCEDEDLLSVYLNLGVVKFSDIDEKRTNGTSETLEKYQLVEPGDFVLNNQQAWRGSVGVSTFRGIVSPAYLVLQLSKLITPLFANYLFRDQIMVSQYLIGSRGVGTIQRNLYWDKLKKTEVLLPPLPEQTVIAQFLDHKTAQIDRAIAIKEEQIKLLNERKQIMIQEAVTKGLDPTVPMKDSGVEWIGEIPEHWEVKKLKYLSEIFRGKFTHRPRNDSRLYDGKYPFFQTGDIARANKYLFKYNQTLNEKGLQISTLIPKGTVVMTIAANIGDVAILDIEACFPDSIIGFKPLSFIINDFLYYSLSVMKTQFIATTIKNTQMNLNVDRVGNHLIVLPPVNKQKEIVNFIEIQTEKINMGVDVYKNQIQALKEYKTTLINEAVTGKIKVN